MVTDTLFLLKIYELVHFSSTSEIKFKCYLCCHSFTKMTFLPPANEGR